LSTQRIIDKLKMKGFEILFVVVLYHDEFTFTFFLAILLLVLAFVMHHLMVLRAEYVIECLMAVDHDA
jgi:uncharacterized membrane protein (DUF485 family)